MEFDNNNLNYISDKIKYELYGKIRSKLRIRRILILYQMMGILTFVFGLLYFTFTAFNIDLSSPQRIALMISGIGIMLTILSYSILTIYKDSDSQMEKEAERIESISTLMFVWANLEKSILQYIESSNKNLNKHSIKQQLKSLFNENVIDEKDIVIIERALEYRNLLVHKGIVLPNIKTNQIIEKIESIIDKINLANKSLHQ